ncbi:MAG: hypothetical protein ACYTFH_03545 [Planctomycetota bacterium]
MRGAVWLGLGVSLVDRASWAAAGVGAGAAADGSGFGLAVAVLLVGGGVLVALLIAVAARAGRRSTITRATTPAHDSADPWVEAGRRQETPPADEGMSP